MTRIVVETETIKALIESLVNAVCEHFERGEFGTKSDKAQALKDVKRAKKDIGEYLKPSKENKP